MAGRGGRESPHYGYCIDVHRLLQDGRALLAQAAAGIDAAAADGASTGEAGYYVEADVQNLLREGARNKAWGVGPGIDRPGEASLDRSKGNYTGR